MTNSPIPAPPWTTTEWLNSEPLTLEALRGKVVALEAFQMLCPGCVSGALPQARRLQQTFGKDLAVIGLHTVFEHHAAMTPVSLKAFVLEYGLRFPIGVDAHNDGLHPITFGRYGMQGTPTTILIDRAGQIRTHHFGAVEDMALAAAVQRLLLEDAPAAEPADTATVQEQPAGTCSVDGVCV